MNDTKVSQKKNMYKIIVLIGEAGSGKDSLMQGVLQENPNLHEIVSYTTRPPREGEIDGINYNFISGEKFGDKVVNGEMIEAACFNGWFYGTGYASLRSDCINIGVFNPTGVESLLTAQDVEILVFYVRASDKERLLRQLNREENPDVMEIIRRFKTDMIDFEHLDFDYIELENNRLDDFDRNVAIITAKAANF